MSQADRAPDDATLALAELKGLSYELFILLVSILSVVNMVIVLVPFFDGPIEDVAVAVDSIIAPIFVMDFLYRLLTAKSRSHYVFRAWGWADLLAAVPTLGIFRVFRVVRVGALLRRVDGEVIARELYAAARRIHLLRDDVPRPRGDRVRRDGRVLRGARGAGLEHRDGR